MKALLITTATLAAMLIIISCSIPAPSVGMTEAEKDAYWRNGFGQHVAMQVDLIIGK